MKNKVYRLTAKILLLAMTYQLVYPLKSLALTTGPSQPEVQSFEPVGTTDMVDMFSGDFNYNIPLMDVEGYPVNIAYHGGINMEQEASWVGLGWNVNPGEINRSVRGLPDDFNGEKVEKIVNIKSEKNVRVGVGANFSLEAFGFSPSQLGYDVSLNFGLYVNYNNYRGVGIGTNVGATISTPVASTGIDIGVGSQTGADIDVNLSFFTSKKMNQDNGAGADITAGTGFNSRSGLKDLSFNISASTKTEKGQDQVSLVGYSTSIPIGLQNYVPVVTNASHQNSFQFQIKGGSAVMYTFPHLYLNALITNVNYDTNGTRSGYGYMYTENADKNGIQDFSRDKDGTYNKTLPNLPLSSMTYDIYSVSGQGTGGMFRPFRNDIGTINDPFTESDGNGADVLAEFGLGPDAFEAGGDVNTYDNQNKSGPWLQLPYGGDKPGSVYEKIFFKQGGELTYNHQQAASQLFNAAPEYLNQSMLGLTGKGNNGMGGLPATYNGTRIYWDGTHLDRSSRANLFSFLTAKEASIPEFAQSQQVPSFSTPSSGKFFDPVITGANRYDDGHAHTAKSYHIGEITQTQADGRRYVYSIPAMNNMQREVSFAANESMANTTTGMVKINRGGSGDDDSKNNKNGRDNFYSSTATPAYAHSYLLTSMLSSDYVDIMGDGPTDDDLGSFVKYNYSLYDNDYRWRSPYSKDPSNDSAQYHPGFISDNQDGKGNYIIGSRQVWHLRSIETKNYIAEFYVSQRNDGMGVKSPVLLQSSALASGNSLSTALSSNSHSYKLDSIKLYNKHDRYMHENNAVPVKTVIFQYDYSLCQGIPNTFSTTGDGKLTLKKIYFRYGNSNKTLLSPYTFSYNNPNPNYDFSAKDRWGNYKQNNPALPNVDYPYTSQDTTGGLNNTLASWNLTDIKLPSGGKIHVQYESDDYSYVQNRKAMQMDMIVGVGSSPVLEHRSHLYENANAVNNYVYFQRRIAMENTSLSFRENYLEGNDKIYYCFNEDIFGMGKYEYVKGYAKVDSMGICPNDNNYGFIKLKNENAGNMSLHPATIYGINLARYYMPHILYPGNRGNGSNNQVLKALWASAGELKRIWQNPFAKFISDGKGRFINPNKSWIRLQVPGLSKKGGGIRVKQLTLNDVWNIQSGNPDSAVYGKQYNYTINDPRYGTISSGVASYEPMVGGDENPFRLPVSYTAEGGRLLPAIDFYQEEPYGEQFFPSPSVGYSSVKVTSIHAATGGSSQSIDEYLYYTAKDFPIVVDYTEKNDQGPIRVKSLRRDYEEEKVLQGYALIFNDMHGKPKAVNNYVVHTDGTHIQNELITGVKYNYQTDNSGRLNNQVKAMVRNRGTLNSYSVGDMTLGQDVDFTVDSRERNFRNYRTSIKANLNTVIFGIFPVPIPTIFTPDKEEQQIFRMLVSTKIIQQYGILKSVESFDHGARTTQQNLIYDAETGTPLLTSTNNEYNDNSYSLKYPAYLAYSGMGQAYMNTGFRETVDSFMVNSIHDGVLYSNNRQNYNPGDELMVSYIDNHNVSQTRKLWVNQVGIDTFGTGQYVADTTKDSTSTMHIKTHVWHYYTGTDILGADSAYTYDTTYTYTYTYTYSSHYAGTHAANKCALLTSPRYMSENGIYWSDTGMFHAVNVKVIRSGRRNNLDKNVQQTVFTMNPYKNNVSDLFTPYLTTIYDPIPFNNLLSASVTTYTQTATAYKSDSSGINKFFVSSSAGSSGNYYNNLNNYVLGLKGNYRMLAEYTPQYQRSYANNHSRTDGVFPLAQRLWTFSSGTTTGACSENNNVLFFNNPYTSRWKNMHTVTKYDVNGNAIEELDAIGNYSAAQYGYNKLLPVAVASNVNQEGFVFDGFEDYNMLMPEYTRRMHFAQSTTASTGRTDGSYVYSLFGNYFTNFQTFGSGSGTTDATMLLRAGQRYSIVDTNDAAGSGNIISTQASHTGWYSLKVNNSFGMSISANLSNTDPAHMNPFTWFTGQPYICDIWVKPFSSTSIGTLVTQFSCTYSSISAIFTQKTGSVDGWYLIEAAFTPASASTVYLNIPTGVFVDDIRIFPSASNMKSFVYDPFTFKLVAQLDENHFATFYEYDQEGLLVRVKKETDKGILTVSESRRSNAKN